MLNNITTKKISEFLTQYCFRVCLVLVFFALMLGGFLLYKYKILAKSAEIYSSGQECLKFEEKDFKKILNQLDKQEKEFIKSDLEIINNVFE